jgi:PST family polysaccharide transporter
LKSLIPTPNTDPELASRAHLDQSLAAGLAWTAAAKWLSQIISWGSFVIVARLLAPSDFGLVGMAVLLSGLLQVATDALGTAVATIRDLSADQLAQLNAVALMAGFAGSLICCGLAVPLGRFFASPHLPLVVIVMSTTFVISGFQTVPYSLLYKDMRFRLLSVVAAIQSVIQALTTLTLAWLGFRYWALVLGNVVGATVLAGLQISCRPYRFARPTFTSIKSALIFSQHITVSSLSWYGYSNADFLVAGRVLGQSALGAYALAWNLAMIPLEKVTSIVSNVAYPYFSAAQDDIVALRRYLRVLTEALSLITFPATIGIALVARDFVCLFLGVKWQGAIVPLEILAFYASFRCIVALLPSVLNVTGESGFVMRVTQGALILMPTAFYLGSRWGTVGIAWAWVFAYPVIAIVLYRRTFRRIKMPWRDYVGAIRPALTGSLVMVAAVEIVKGTLLPSFPLSFRFACEVLTGVAACFFGLMIFHRDRLSVFFKFVRTLRAPVRVSPPVQGTSV